MFLEYQLSAEALVRNVRNQLLSSHLGAGTAFNLGDEQLMVDRVQLLESSELVRRQASFPVATSDGSVSVAGSKATLVLPVQVDLVEVDDLITNSATASTPFKKLPLKVLIDVTASVHQAQARLRFAFESIDFGLAGALVDEATRAQINSVVAAQIPPTSRVIDVHALQSVMGGMSMKVTNAGATTNDNGELLAVRIEINGDGKQISEWTEFFNHYQSKLPSGHDWSLLIDQQLLRKSISAQVQAGLSGSSAQFALRSGINTSWIPWASSFNVTFSGEAINACTCLWGEIDVDVDVTNSLALSVPGRDTLRLRLHLDYDLNDLEVFCCILTATLFWPIVGIIYGAKEPGALLGYVGGPALVFIGACVLTSNESLVSGSLDAISMGGEPQKLDDTTRQWDVPFTMDMGKLGGVYHLDRLLPLPAGPLLSGSVSDLGELANPLLQIIHVEPFKWRNQGSCNTGWNHPPVQEARLAWSSSTPNSRLNVSQARVIDDPRHIFHMSWWPGSGATIVASPTPKYLEHPYPCRVLIISNGGVRIISLDTAAPLSEPEGDALEQLAAKARAGCLLAINKLPWSIARYRWLPDPSPLDKITQLWQVVVAKLPAGTEVQLVDAQRNVLASASAGRQGVIQLSFWSGLEASIDELAVHVKRPAAHKGVPVRATVGTDVRAPIRSTKAHISVKQIQLALRSQIPVTGQLVDFDVTRDDRTTIISVTSSAGSWRYDVTRLATPSLLESRYATDTSEPVSRANVASVSGQKPSAKRPAIRTQKNALGEHIALPTKVLHSAVPAEARAHTQSVKMAGVKNALCIRDSKGTFTITDASDTGKPKSIGQYFHTPWFFQSKRNGKLLAKLSDSGCELLIYEVIQTKEV